MSLHSIFFFSLLMFVFNCDAQQQDLLNQHAQSFADIDSLRHGEVKFVYVADIPDNAKLFGLNAPVQNDIQQPFEHKNDGWNYLLLFVLFGIVTYVRLAFTKKIDDLISYAKNRNVALQIFRSVRDIITLPSILLSVMFVVAVSLFVQSFFNHVVRTESSTSTLTTFYLIILFTSFYVIKIVVVRIMGWLFAEIVIAEQYAFSIAQFSQIAGLTLLPILLLVYTATDKLKIAMLWLGLLTLVVIVAWLIYYGLSTAGKLMYRSVKSFFIYVCFIEMPSVFLFIKLLTKTVS